MPVIHLTDRATVRILGAEAEHFLQNLITTDLSALAPKEAKPGALLSPQGKILFDFLIARTGADAFMLDCAAVQAADLIRRLTLYKLRAKVEIGESEQRPVAISWDDDSGTSGIDSEARRDTRFISPTVRHYRTLPAATNAEEEWHRLRVRSGIAEGGRDYALGEAFPHDVLLDQNGGVGLRKGCYVGQEVVSRMQHRGTARRRVLIATSGTELPPAGTDILAEGRPLGALGTVLGKEGLAIARIDRVKAAIDKGSALTAEGVELSLAIPEWASFTFPEAAAETGQA